MAKYPYPGKVKTRLGKEIGYENSAQIFRELLERYVEVASSIAEVTIVTHPPMPNYPHYADFKKDYPSWDFFQANSSLLQGKVSDCLFSLKKNVDSGLEKVVLTTGDLVVSSQEVEGWFSKLDEVDIVVGPTKDLRFYGVGFKNSALCSFVQAQDKDISTIGYLKGVVSCLCGFHSIGFLPFKRDIDTKSDLEKEFALGFAK